MLIDHTYQFVAGPGKGWAKNGYVHFDVVHAVAKAHFDAGCTYLIQSAKLHLHVAKESKALRGTCILGQCT